MAQPSQHQLSQVGPRVGRVYGSGELPLTNPSTNRVHPMRGPGAGSPHSKHPPASQCPALPQHLREEGLLRCRLRLGIGHHVGGDQLGSAQKPLGRCQLRFLFDTASIDNAQSVRHTGPNTRQRRRRPHCSHRDQQSANAKGGDRFQDTFQDTSPGFWMGCERLGVFVSSLPDKMVSLYL